MKIHSITSTYYVKIVHCIFRWLAPKQVNHHFHESFSLPTMPIFLILFYYYYYYYFKELTISNLTHAEGKRNFGVAELEKECRRIKINLHTQLFWMSVKCQSWTNLRIGYTVSVRFNRT